MTTSPKDTGFEAQPYYGICTFGRAPRGEYSDSFIVCTQSLSGSFVSRILSGAAGAFFDYVALRSECARCGVEGAADTFCVHTVHPLSLQFGHSMVA